MDPERLLAHRDFVRALARGLLFDEDRAEDVAQETWLAALQRPPRRGGTLRPWLAAVARNLARNLLRSESRRTLRERRAARPESVPSTEEVFEREAARRRVVEAVVALEEPYRAAILLRYYEDLRPREIARRLDLPVETVRTRIKRGLQALRETLDARHGGSRANWASTLLPLAAPPAKASFVLPLAGVLAVKSFVKVAAAVLLAVTGFVAWKALRPPDTGPTLAAAQTALPLPGAAEAPTSPESPPPPAPTRSEESTVLGSRPLDITGRVEDDRGVPIQGARVEAGGEPAVTDAAGRFRIAGVRESEVEVRATHSAHFDGRAGWRAGEPPDAEMTVRLDRRLYVVGVFLDGQEDPVEGAWVRITKGLEAVPGVKADRTGADGRFELKPLRPGIYRLHGSTPLRGWSREEEIDLTDSLPGVVLRLEDGHFGIAGRILDCSTGEPLGGLRVSGEVIVRGRKEGGFGGGTRAEDGAFGTTGMFRTLSDERAVRVVLTVAGPEHEPRILGFPTGMRVKDGVESCLVRRRAGRGRIEGRIRFDDGTTLDGPLVVRVFRPDATPRLPPSEPESREVLVTRGHFVLEDLEPGDLGAWPVVPGEPNLEWEMAKILHVDPFETTRVEWTIPRGGDLRVEARDDHGSPLEEFHLVLENDARKLIEKGRDGLLVLRNVPPGTYRLRPRTPPLEAEEQAIRIDRGAEVTAVISFRRP